MSIAKEVELSPEEKAAIREKEGILLQRINQRAIRRSSVKKPDSPDLKPWAEVFDTGGLIDKYVDTRGRCLNYGCAGRPVAGWDNYDPNIPEFAVLHPEENIYSTIVAWHVFEHIASTPVLFQALETIYDMLSPGGHLIACCPHAQSKTAFDSPFHVRYFTDATWGYFTRTPYEVKDTMGYNAQEGMWIPPWECVFNAVLVKPEATEFEKENWRSLWNVATDTLAVFKK